MLVQERDLDREGVARAGEFWYFSFYQTLHLVSFQHCSTDHLPFAVSCSSLFSSLVVQLTQRKPKAWFSSLTTVLVDAHIGDGREGYSVCQKILFRTPKIGVTRKATIADKKLAADVSSLAILMSLEDDDVNQVLKVSLLL